MYLLRYKNISMNQDKKIIEQFMMFKKKQILEKFKKNER